MNNILRIFLYLLIFFMFVMFGAELNRWNDAKRMVYREMELACLDAMEVTVDEELKQDQILYIEDPDKTKQIINELIQQNLGMDLSSSQVTNNSYIRNLQITKFEVFPGEYEEKDDMVLQRKIPTVSIEGNFSIIPFILRYGDLSFETRIENTTEYIFRE